MKLKKGIKIKINRKGFSLIEMMVALGILSLIIIGLVTFFSGGTRAWVTGQYQLEAQRNARLAMDRMVREIREGKSISSDSNVTKAKVNYLTSFGKNPVTYQLNGTTIEREVNSAYNQVIDNVQSLAFKYLDSSDTEVVLPLTPEKALEISKVHIELEVDVDKDDSPDITLNTDVNLRNYGYEL